ncbi:type IV pilus secretin PilQ [Desulfurobacterium crinifex]
MSRWLLSILFFLLIGSGKAGIISEINAIYDGNIFEISFREDGDCQLIPLSTKAKEIKIDLKGCKVKSPISIGERGDLIKRVTMTPANNSSLLTIELKKDAKFKTSIKNNFVSIKVIPSELVKPEIRVEKFSEGELVKINLEKKPKNVTYRKVSDGFLITLSGLKLEKFSLSPESQLVKKVETLDVPTRNVIKVTLAKFNSVEITNRDKEVMIKVFELPESKETKSEINSKDIKNMTVSLKFDNADVRAVVKAITKSAGVNVVVDPEVKGRVNVDFRKPVLWKRALKAVLDPLGFTYKEERGYLRILPKSKIKAEEQLEPLRFYVVRLNYADAEEVKKEIEELVFKYHKETAKETARSGNTKTEEKGRSIAYKETVTVDKSNNALLLKIIPSHYKEIMKVIKEIDRPIKQVMIKAKIVIVDSEINNDLGMSWFIRGYNNIGSGINTYITGTYGFLPFTPNSSVPTDGTLAIGILNPTQTLKLELAIKALETENKGQVISNPKVLVFDNQEAEIEQGIEIPYKKTTTTQTSTEVSYEFKKARLLLKVKPHVTHNNHVIMDIEIKKEDPKYTLSEEGAPPSINTRNMKSKVRIASGNTIVIGGVYEKRKDFTKNAVPVLSEIPLLGWLFKYEKTKITNNKLLIFITPEIID